MIAPHKSDKPWSTAVELAMLQDEIAELGRTMDAKRARILEILDGRIATERHGQRFMITRARLYQGGAGFNVFVEGPMLKKDGSLHPRNAGSSPIALLQKIERAPKL